MYRAEKKQSKHQKENIEREKGAGQVERARNKRREHDGVLGFGSAYRLRLGHFLDMGVDVAAQGVADDAVGHSGGLVGHHGGRRGRSGGGARLLVMLWLLLLPLRLCGFFQAREGAVHSSATGPPPAATTATAAATREHGGRGGVALVDECGSSVAVCRSLLLLRRPKLLHPFQAHTVLA